MTATEEAPPSEVDPSKESLAERKKRRKAEKEARRQQQQGSVPSQATDNSLGVVHEENTSSVPLEEQLLELQRQRDRKEQAPVIPESQADHAPILTPSRMSFCLKVLQCT
jgi:hypothetical protein